VTGRVTVLALVLVLAVRVGSLAGADLTTGLILDYTFDGQPTGYTVHGATKTADRFGIPGQAYFFNGLDSYLDLPDEATAQFTVSIWVRTGWGNSGPLPIPIVDGWSGGEVFAIQYRDNLELIEGPTEGPFASEVGEYVGYVGPGNYLIGSFHPWASDSETEPESNLARQACPRHRPSGLSPKKSCITCHDQYPERHLAYPLTLDHSTWRHVAISYDGALARLYLDGSQVVSFKFDENLTTTPADGLDWDEYLALVDLALARSKRFETFFYGSLDEFRLYNRALSAEEVAELAR